MTSKQEFEGERKQVTVLFADIVGSFGIIADRDPEEAQKLLDPILDLMLEAVHHYEGMVSRVMGDGIMALFGAPVAHEDHAVRACYSALRMQQTISQRAEEIRRLHGTPITIRVGINSGEIVVSSINNDLYMDYTIVGQTAHLASRMEQMALPGSILATTDTMRLVEGYVEAKPLGALPIKGLAYPVEVYEITEGGTERTGFQAAAWRGLTPFVGRTLEMKQIEQALEHARAGHGQVVAVVGEPGMGKSRLIHEFVHSSRTTGCLLLETNSASYGHAASYLPVIELLRHYYFKINRRDDPNSIREKVTEKVLSLDPLLQDTIAPLLDLLDALDAGHPFQSLDPLQHRQHTYQAITKLLLRENRVQPVVAVFEDLHWNDSLTLGLLDEIIVNARDARLLLLVTYRPEFQDQWKGRPNYRNLRLEPLESESLTELLQSLLGSDAALDGLKRFVLDRAGGNPFFLEELVRTLVDRKVLQGTREHYTINKPFSGNEIPPTVQAVLAARIDTLPKAEKRLLQEASVVGQDVPLSLIHDICGLNDSELRGLLGNLQAAEFIYPTQLFPDLQFSFKHALTHDVAYAGLRSDKRREIHRLVVDAIERQYAGRIGEQVERLADHALRGQLPEKAVMYLREAGRKAADREAYPEAVILLEQALDALAQLPQDIETIRKAIDIRFDIRNVLQPLGDRRRIATYLDEAGGLAAQIDDKQRMGWVQSHLTEQFWMLGQYPQSIDAGEQALTVADQVSDLPLRVVTNLPLGLAHHTRGSYAKAREYFGWNATNLNGELVGERFGMFVLPSSFSRSFIAWGLADTGNFSEAFSIGEDGLRIAETAGHPFSCGYAHLGLGVVALRQGNLRRALRSFERSLAAGAFADSPVGFAYVSLHLGYGLALSGRANEGIPILERSIELAQSRGFVARHALRLAYVSEAYLLLGRDNDARNAAQRALELARQHGERANEAYSLRMLGEVESYRNELGDAEGWLTESLSLATELGMRPLAAHCHKALANVFDLQHRKVEAERHRDISAAMIEAMEMRFWA
ncbi:adenylate/guanylate cyclase domain-containing protein [Bradyrhizobium lablabi]|uniref:ATP-binding protein n=1 Tax=Bradyrhizobium lablabi TaxID=722472 RepID=UPI002011A825|nr:adenylate/guanylate cyclase domain-containing protein [Bradyrhizobium lablabi]